MVAQSVVHRFELRLSKQSLRSLHCPHWTMVTGEKCKVGLRPSKLLVYIKQLTLTLADFFLFYINLTKVILIYTKKTTTFIRIVFSC